MKNIFKKFDIANLLVKKILGQQSEEEANKIDHWVNDNNQDVYRNIFSIENYELFQKDIGQIDANDAWKEYLKQMSLKRSPKTRILPLVIRYAAAILIPALIAGALFYYGYDGFFKDRKTLVADNIIAPGEKKALLILSDGQQVVLNENQKESIVEADGSAILSDSLTLDYQNIGDGEQLAALYNELHVKRGWEWQLTLDDGTKVWINSMSVLKYPVRFNVDERVVELTGEAYFEVAHNPEKPFIVKTPSYEVEVLGTSFNVSHYDNDEISHVTLAEGKVKVKSSFLIDDEYKTYELMPDQQFYFDETKMEAGVKEVNSSVYTDWIEGDFVFEDETLDNIFKKLSRWYKIEYFFDDQRAHNEIFSGKFPKFENFQTITDMMEKVSDIRVDVDSNIVLIYKP